LPCQKLRLIVIKKGDGAVFAEKIFWVTGASSGLGEALAKTLAAESARLILSGRNEAELRRVAADCGAPGQHLILPFDVTEFDHLPQVTEQAFTWRGQIDGLINNAGISQRSLATETDFSVYQRMINTDLLAPIALTQRVLPHMVKAKSGRIVMITSVAGKAGSPMRTAYSAAKFGLNGYAEALRCEVAMHGINVHTIAPGSIKTNVSVNALTGDGSRRGESDPAIENGMDPLKAAKRMIAAIKREERDIVIARGFELKMTQMRKRSPNKLFDAMAATVARGYAAQMKAGAKS
jgi:dehydrogenase/reductase SDR family member 7B